VAGGFRSPNRIGSDQETEHDDFVDREQKLRAGRQSGECRGHLGHFPVPGTEKSAAANASYRK